MVQLIKGLGCFRELLKGLGFFEDLMVKLIKGLGCLVVLGFRGLGPEPRLGYVDTFFVPE